MSKSKILFWSSAVAFIISSFSVILMLLEVSDIFSGIVFWAGMLIGTILYVISYKLLNAKKRKSRIPAVFRFFSNKTALVIDIIMLLCLIITIYYAVNYRSNQMIAGVILFLLILSAYGHFLFNVKVYKYIIKKKKIIKGGYDNE